VSLRRLLFWLVLLSLLVILRPGFVWQEVKRIRAQWDTILRLLVLVVGAYLLYGLYTIWANGGLG